MWMCVCARASRSRKDFKALQESRTDADLMEKYRRLMLSSVSVQRLPVRSGMTVFRINLVTSTMHFAD